MGAGRWPFKGHVLRERGGQEGGRWTARSKFELSGRVSWKSDRFGALLTVATVSIATRPNRAALVSRPLGSLVSGLLGSLVSGPFGSPGWEGCEGAWTLCGFACALKECNFGVRA